jgi:signal transduction histidine kinase
LTGGGGRHPAPFAPLVYGTRWATLAIGLVLVPVRGPLVRPLTVAAWMVVLAAHATWRTFRPLPSAPGARVGARAGSAADAAPFLADAALVSLAVISTGFWSSPFAFSLLTPVMAGSFAHGFGFGARLAGAMGAAVSLPYGLAAAGTGGFSLLSAAQWVGELLLVAAMAGYARRLFGEAEQQHVQALNRMSRLVEANQLLEALHRVAQSLPASLNLDQVLASTLTRVRSLIATDVVAVLVRDDATLSWSVAAGDGTRLGLRLADHELPPPLAAAMTSSVASLAVCLEPGEGIGPEFLSHSGLYAPLRARGRLVGLIALEHHAPGFYGRRELQLLDGFIEPVAMAIDNARWFARLRAIGADEERVRIARDMHDRIGQSLAGVAFSLDRLRGRAADPALAGELDGLRTEVREALGEVRETLADLRTEVSDERGVAAALALLLARVEARSPFAVTFTNHEVHRLPLVQERELWRIAQEAIVNAERHGHPHHLSVRWESDGRRALLTVADDGAGFAPGAGRPDSYGLTGMRERADAIGATLVVDSAPGSGTMVRCALGPQ